MQPEIPGQTACLVCDGAADTGLGFSGTFDDIGLALVDLGVDPETARRLVEELLSQLDPMPADHRAAFAFRLCLDCVTAFNRRQDVDATLLRVGLFSDPRGVPEFVVGQPGVAPATPGSWN